MKKRRLSMLILILSGLVAPVLLFGFAGSGEPVAAQGQAEGCPPPEVIEAQRELLENLRGEYIAIRAFKDATLNELGRQNATHYSLRAILLRSLIERELLILERAAILENADGLSPEDQDRLLEIEDRLFELSILLDGANDRLQAQLDLLIILWRPVIDLIKGVGVERYERYTQRILEVREGAGQGALEVALAVLNDMLACAGIPVIPTVMPPTPSGVGN